MIGKIAIVTGAGSGIGRSTSKLLSQQGAKVIVADRNLKAAKETQNECGPNAAHVELDVASMDSIQKAVKEIISKLQAPPSIVVNCAGITKDGYLLKMTEKDYDDVYEVNLKGTFMMTQQFARAMVEHNISGGSIINLASIVAKMGNVGQANYVASKAGVIGLTEVAAREFGKFGIRVNAVLPGFIDTPMVAVVPEKIKEELIRSRCPLGRLGKPEEIAEVIAFLASSKSSYVNGASIEVTGGLK